MNGDSKHRRDMSDVCDWHKPIQHRDGKPPWCHRCGLTADYTEPVSKFDQFRAKP